MVIDVNCSGCGLRVGELHAADDTPPAVIAYRLSGILSRCDDCQAAQDALDNILAEPPAQADP